MFKITKNKIHKREFKSRKNLKLERASNAQQMMLNLIQEFERNPKKFALLLQQFFENEEQKRNVKGWVAEESLTSFDTAWEGARLLLRATKEETSARILKADMDLLCEDLDKLRNYLLSPQVQ
ncbi:MAG: hypothetical protein S4CHLAM7_14740 [Chlamydiae bacterium]|nr:hypothetical protein [Chlamydiota bacterium]